MSIEQKWAAMDSSERLIAEGVCMALIVNVYETADEQHEPVTVLTGFANRLRSPELGIDTVKVVLSVAKPHLHYQKAEVPYRPPEEEGLRQELLRRMDEFLNAPQPERDVLLAHYQAQSAFLRATTQ